MPALEDAELVRIPCPRCFREHFVYVDRATREALAYDGSGTRVLAGETLPTAFIRLLNAPCDECRRVRDLEQDFIARRLAELSREPSGNPHQDADSGAC